ncbi:MAG: transcription antitermination factor NusB [Clostridia bacterium]|nr:transcription antitermination factor NusB [Clostridia bacterium]
MRSLARETAFKVVYKSLFLNGDLTVDELLEEDKITEEEDKDYVEDSKFISELVSLYAQNQNQINEIINSKLKGYTPERVYRIDRAILAIAITEMLFYKQTPFKVVINEAVEIAKKYSTEKSYSFVNGVLKAIVEEQNVI